MSEIFWIRRGLSEMRANREVRRRWRRAGQGVNDGLHRIHHTGRMRSLATFRLVGDGGGSAARVTELLGLTPSDSVEMGEFLRSRRPAETSSWSLRSAPGPLDDVELATALNNVLDQLEPVSEAVWELAREGYWANWFCYVGSNAAEHAVELDRQTLGRALALPGELWLDVYPDEDDGEENDTEPSEPHQPPPISYRGGLDK